MSDQDLATKVQELSALVHKQSEMIAKTGQQLLEMQVKDVKAKMGSMEPKAPKFDPEDFATNEDIVQLVCELQGQLDFMEERSVSRVFNSHVSSNAADKIAPLCNRDGAPPPPCFPTTVGELKAIVPEDLVLLCEFYELITENEPNQEMQDLIKAEELTPEDAEKLFGSGKADGEVDVAQKAKDLSAEEIDELFDELARFIGVRIRRGSGW